MTGTLDSKALDSQITELVEELYQTTVRQIKPAKPWIVVYVLPKEQKRNGLFLPDRIQNKPVFEGIALATWQPWTEERTIKHGDGRETSKLILHKSDVETGDHVLFEHWAGVPLQSDAKINSNFRMVREHWNSNEGGIFATIHRGLPNPHTVLSDVIYDAVRAGTALSSDDLERLSALVASKIEHRFMMVDKTLTSVTLSGV